jgi:hypothetical protein
VGKKPGKTNTMCMHETADVAYRTETYVVDESDLSGAQFFDRVALR